MAPKARAARVDLTLSKTGFDRGVESARRTLRGFARDGRKSLGDLSDYGKRASFGDLDKSLRELAGPVMGRFGRSVGRASVRGLKVGLGALAVGATAGGVAVMSLADDVLTLERDLIRYQIATDMSDAALAQFRGGLSATARATGLGRQELLAGAQAYVALTGDVAGATQGMELFGKVRNATGAAMADIAAVAASMKDNLGIKPSDFEAGFSALAVQGKAGAVELRELATQLAGIAPSFGAFKNGAGVAGLVEMGAALQVVRKGFGSSAEGATGMRSLMVALQRNAAKFQKAGVQIYDKDPKTGKKRLRDFSDIIDGIAKSKLAKDPTLLTKAFGADEAKRAYDQLAQNRGLLDQLIRSGSDQGAIQRDADKYLASPAGRISKAWELVKLKVAEAFTPERIESFATALEHVVATIADAIDGLEMLAARMGGQDNRVFGPALMGKVAGAAAAGGGTGIPRMPDFRTAGNPGTTLGGPLEPMEAGVRYLAGRSRDHDLGAGIRWIASAMQAAQRPAAGGGATVINVALKVGADELARAQANAPGHRTVPGGM